VTPVLRAALRTALRAPAPLRRRLVGEPPRNDRGVALDRDVHLMLRLEERVFGGLARGEPAAARASMRRAIEIAASRPLRCAVRDARVAGVPVRVYGDAGPPFVYLHGGGWVQGDLDTHDALCRRIAVEAGRVVTSVGYRLAPEHPFPAGLEDVVAVLRALPGAEVGGDSAGGNLAAAACLVLRDAGDPLPARQVLIYPALDQRRVAPSHRLFARGFLLTAADMDWFQGHYRFGDPLDPRASPLLAPDLRGLPPAVVATAGFDPLRDEGEAYAAALRVAGVPVVHLDEAALVHGYANMDGAVRAADAAVARLVAAIR
jgi:acetyl esterase